MKLRLFPCFNSILVRLKDPSTSSTNSTSLKFQFHTGSIKSAESRESARIHLRFQFHTGSIKRKSVSLILQQTVPSFNSILVRLKDWVEDRRTDDYGQFQFHTGSIKSGVCSVCNFQAFMEVSIPYWFD